jgi:cation diffusion facilitator CzcD-associated flavoprotein CzcO
VPFPNPGYSRLTGFIHGRVPALGRLTYRAYRKAFEFSAQALIAPGWRRTAVAWLCRTNLRTVRDPELRAALTPDYQPMCRRLVVSSGFYPAMQLDHVGLVTDGIDHVEREGIVTTDGQLHRLDVIALATGFDAHAFMRPMKLTGRDGLTIEQAWADGPRAHLTVAVPGFPNFFMLMGPHSPVGNYALTAIAETQADHILGWIDRWRDRQFDSVAPTPTATDEFNADMREAMPGTVWTTGCTSWYLGSDGLPELWPWTPDRHRSVLGASPRVDDYELRAVSILDNPKVRAS